MAETNKIRYGLKNVHVGKVTVTDDDVEMSAPTKYPGAVSMTLDAEGETTPFYADNTIYYIVNTNNGYTGELEMAYLYDWFEKEYLGSKESNEGMIVEVADAEPITAYFMFQFEGDKNATKYIVYNTIFSRPSLEGSTKEDTTEPATTTIPFTTTPLETAFGKIVRAKVPSTATNYANFFNQAPDVPGVKN